MTPTPGPSGPSEAAILRAGGVIRSIMGHEYDLDHPDVKCIALAIDAHTARITAERDSARAEAATLRAEVEAGRMHLSIDAHGRLYISTPGRRHYPDNGPSVLYEKARAAVDALPQPREVKE